MKWHLYLYTVYLEVLNSEYFQDIRSARFSVTGTEKMVGKQ